MGRTRKSCGSRTVSGPRMALRWAPRPLAHHCSLPQRLTSYVKITTLPNSGLVHTVKDEVNEACRNSIWKIQDAAEKRRIIKIIMQILNYTTNLIAFWTRRFQGDLHSRANTPLTSGGSNDRPFLCRTCVRTPPDYPFFYKERQA
jgi:hypothetical protein